MENSCSHTCVDQKLDKTPDAYVFMFMCRDGAPCFKHELVRIWKGLDITPSVILNKSVKKIMKYNLILMFQDHSHLPI